MEKIEWKEWSKETFELAKKEDKLVLLDIYGSWCYWCKRMDKDSYSDKDIIELVNEKFIPIKVNTDKQPDINSRYNMGGWPTTAILNAKGEIVTGGTYSPPEKLYDLLIRTLELFSSDREKFDRFVKEHKRIINIIKPPSGKPEEKDLEMIDNLSKKYFDKENWGFGKQPKFPMTFVIKYCLLRGKTSSELLEIAEKSLLAEKKIFDEDEGGFFRYAVNSDWTSPHYEKMLETNTLILMNNLDAAAQLKKEIFKKTSEETIDYIQKNLMETKEKWFFGSQEADEKYYKLNFEERKKKQKPGVEKTLYVDLNCKMVNALLKASFILENKEYRKNAFECFDFIIKNCFDEKKGVCHYWDGTSHSYGLLADNVALAVTMLNMFEVTQEKKYLEMTEKLVEWIFTKFWDEKQKVLVDIEAGRESDGYFRIRKGLLNENCEMVGALVKLSMLLEKDSLKKKAETIIVSFKGEIKRIGLFSAPYGIALEQFLNPVKISVEGNWKLLEETLSVFDPRIVRKFEEEKEDKIEVCVGTTCLKPVKTVEELEELLKTNA